MALQCNEYNCPKLTSLTLEVSFQAVFAWCIITLHRNTTVRLVHAIEDTENKIVVVVSHY